jgi:hypothetical protein
MPFKTGGVPQSWSRQISKDAAPRIAKRHRGGRASPPARPSMYRRHSHQRAERAEHRFQQCAATNQMPAQQAAETQKGAWRKRPGGGRRECRPRQAPPQHSQQLATFARHFV